jgi:hypothetical protein
VKCVDTKDVHGNLTTDLEGYFLTPHAVNRSLGFSPGKQSPKTQNTQNGRATAGGLKPTLLENTKNVAWASGRANNQPKYKTLKKAEQSRAG